MGERQLKTNLESGVVTIAIPYPMSATDIGDLKDWLALLVRTLERTKLGTGSESATGLAQCTATSPARQ